MKTTSFLTEPNRKPALTIGMIAKNEIFGITSNCMTVVGSFSPIVDNYSIIHSIMLNQSDLPKARSAMLTTWYDNSKPGDLFMSIDADQIFKAEDILRCILLTEKYDIVCAAYPRKSGNLAVEPIDIVNFYKNKGGLLHFGATGMMMIKYSVVDKLAKHLKEKIHWSSSEVAYPFYYERIITDNKIHIGDQLWLGEDYSFCWLASTYADAKIYGFVSPTVGHIVTQEKMASVPTPQTWPSKSIAVYCGATSEPWNARSLETGIGGSESAVIHLTKYWAKHGYDVKVFCTCTEPGVYDGVSYENTLLFNVVDNFDIIIVWRCVPFAHIYQINARKKFLDFHDIVKPSDNITERSINNMDKFCVKSNYQRKMLPTVPDDKIALIPNGGAVEKTEVKKDKNYIIYSSSYDRGLEEMLKWGWPKIKKACPKAYFKVYYGWNVFDKLNKNSPDALEYKRRMTELLSQDGVEECGRVSNEELIQEKRKANIHYYVSTFQEIDCISIRESACCGAIPVVSDYAVFPEKKYCVCVPGDSKTQEVQEKAADEIIRLLNDEDYYSKIKSSLVIPYEETWENTAQKWMEMF